MEEAPIFPFEPGRLDVVPTHLVEAIREAIASEDEDVLQELVDGVAEHDADVAAYLDELLEALAYDTLEDLFDVRGR